MKIIHLISGGDVGGAKTHVLSLLSGLDCAVRMICFRDGAFAQEARELGIPTEIVSGGVVKAVKTLKSIVRREKPDLIHCHGSRGNLMGACLKQSLKIPVLTTVHSDYRLDYLGRPVARFTYGVINAMALKYIDYRIGVSDAMGELLIKRGFPPQRVFAIYNGIDCGPREVMERAEFFKSHGIDAAENAVFAGIAARLDQVKDIPTLLRAIARIKEVCPQLGLLIAGTGGELENLKKLAADLQIADRVHFLGWLEDIDSFYSSIDINVLTSLYETFPYALTEGGRMNLATIATSVGGIPRLIQSGYNGMLIAKGDDLALSAHLQAFYENPTLRRQMGERLGETVREKYSLEATRRTQLDIYKKILRADAQKKEGGRAGVTICGSYGHGNSGDEAILDAIIQDLKGIDPDMPICVVSRRPKWTQMAHRVSAVHSFHLFGLMKQMKKSKLFISGGGSLIQNVTSRRSLWYYLFSISLAKKMGNRVMMYGCGIGPVTGKGDRRRASHILNKSVDGITLRDKQSMDELCDMGVKNPKIVLSADPALALLADPPEMIASRFAERGIPLEGNYICFALRDWPGFSQKAAVFARAAEYAYEKYGLTPVFLSISPETDGEAEKQVRDGLRVPSFSMGEIQGYGAIMGALSKMRLVVAMRLHGLVFAASQGVPLIGVVYDPKVRSFLKYMKQEIFVDLLVLSEEGLEGMIDEAIEIPRETLQARHKELLRLQAENPKMAKRLLQSKNPKA